MTCRGGVLYQTLRELVGQRKETIPTSVIHATAATRDNLRKHSSAPHFRIYMATFLVVEWPSSYGFSLISASLPLYSKGT